MRGPRPSTPVAYTLFLLLCIVRRTAAAVGLVDKPLFLPGRAAGVSTAAAASRPQPVERFGYFSPASNPSRKIFYWFYQARSIATGAPLNTSTTPLIAWFNGGPGCSSLWGMFVENGPFLLDNSGQLTPNNFTWAAAGHMLYIDQPIGTGLSYSTKKGDATRNQLDVAQTVIAFLQAFLKAPAYKYLSQNPLYLTGESFAGHYLPSIGAYMKFSAPHMKLSGIALGNPCTNAPADYSSYPNWAYSKGLLDAATYKTAIANLASCKLQVAVSSVLDKKACTNATNFCEDKLWQALTDSHNSLLGTKNPYNIHSTARSCNTTDVVNCYDPVDKRVEAYINANKVRLGVPPSITYLSCADAPYYALVSDIADYDDLVAALVDNAVPVMVYSGESDFVCNSLSSEQWLDGLIWSKQRAWKTAAFQNWAGGTFKRAGGLSYVRVANAGHMVPMDQPAKSLAMLRQWIAAGQPVART